MCEIRFTFPESLSHLEIYFTEAFPKLFHESLFSGNDFVDESKMSSKIYCGNNAYDIGDRRLGTRYECLKMGIGKGLHSDLKGYNPNYRAIDETNTYCGTKETPPPGKVFGTRTDCLRKGIGIGKKLHYEKIKYKMENNYYMSFFEKYWPIILAVGVAAFLLLTTDKDLMAILGWSTTVFFAGWVFDKFVMKR